MPSLFVHKWLRKSKSRKVFGRGMNRRLRLSTRPSLHVFDLRRACSILVRYDEFMV